MLFDFETFSKLVEQEYNGGAYSLEQVLDVFRCYFVAFEVFTKGPHPNIRREQIRRIIQAMPYLDEYRTGPCDLDADAYPVLIGRHFRTPYRNCDYNINHFFSGRIRELRFYEELY